MAEPGTSVWMTVPSGSRTAITPSCTPAGSTFRKFMRGRADEARDEACRGPAVDAERRADLLDAAVVHDDDARRHRHRLDLVVRHEHHRRAHALVQPRQLDPGARAQRGVEIGERLVEQEGARLLHDGAADGDALALAARELARTPLQQRVHLQHLRGRLHALRDLVLRQSDIDEAEGEIVPHGHVRIERVVLEHHRDAALAGRRLVDTAALDVDLA